MECAFAQFHREDKVTEITVFKYSYTISITPDLTTHLEQS